MTAKEEVLARTTAGAGRYRIESMLGEGGMAVVQRVLDSATGRSLALKRLLGAPMNPNASQAHILELFEREYLTLAQLAHPQIVAVYDYGIDEDGPYYTMELLDGGDLQTLAPVPWQQACAWAGDVCSALALVHSRRLVYRDLSPRNVRCTSDGRVKLIDFGAMAPMGVSSGLVGTLPCVPPEALHQQALDARTDLYALGATLYFTLTQRHAYPAREMVQLRDFWRSRPRRPAEIVAHVPEALDRLIMELLQLDPARRPASAAEVIERLGAVLGRRASEQLQVSQAYLSNPTLVGRTAQLARVRKLTEGALHGRGVSALIEGPPGLGRTRFLAACVLEAKLAGSLVLHADGLNARGAPFDVVRAFARQLLQAVRGLAIEAAEPHIALLGRVIPELLVGRDHVVLDVTADPEQLHRQVQAALRQWLLAIANKRPLLIAIDNLPNCDEASVAFISLLAQVVSEHSVMIAATGSLKHQPAYTRGALDLFIHASTTLELEPLTQAQTAELLRSVFGDVPNVDAVAADVHRITAGNLRDIMRLAQHLVTETAIRYSAGAWRLPARLSAAELPASMADALRARIARLSLSARTIALGLACEAGQRFTFDECAALLSGDSNAALLRALDELIEAELLFAAGERYALMQQGWTAALLGSATPEQTAAVHLRLAEVFRRRGDGFRVAKHLLAGNEVERGLDALLIEARLSEERTDADPRLFYETLHSLPVDWLSTYELGLRCCGEQDRPAKQVDILLSRLTGLISSSVSQTDGYTHIQRRLDRLRAECGLDLFAAQAATVDFATRLKHALEGAAARYAQTPERERVFEPAAAMRQLGKTVLAAIGTIAFSLDYEAFRRVPPLAPLAPLAPGLAVVEQLRQGFGYRITARSEAMLEIYDALIERLARPDRGGLDISLYQVAYFRVQLGAGTLEAAMGRASSLERAAQVERESAYALQAQTIRHLYHVWQGDTAEATRYKRSIEVQQVESGTLVFEGQNLLSELCAYGLADDMTRVRRATEAIELRAQIHHAWRPVYLYGRGEHSRIRGDYAAARSELESALELVQPGTHQVWPNLAGAYLRTLFELGRFGDVKALGTAYLKYANESGFGYVRNYLRMPLSLALSKLGEHTEALSLAQIAIDEMLALGGSGLNLAAAYDVRARIDLELGDNESAERHATLAAQEWRTGRKALSLGRQSEPNEIRTILDREHDESSELSQFSSILKSHQSEAQRARCGLEYLGRHSGALGGFLYLSKKNGLVRVASFGDADATPELDDFSRSYFECELDAAEATEAHGESADEQAGERAVSGTRRYRPVLLTHQAPAGTALTGLALLLISAETAFTYPSRLAAELSRTVSDAGDALSSLV